MQNTRNSKWFKKHSGWLFLSAYLDAIFPFIPIGIWGFPYHVHHTNYKNVGSEILGRDVICVSPFTHFLLHLLGGSLRVKSQVFGKYPNFLQSAFHWWARIPFFIKWYIIYWVMKNKDHLMIKISSIFG